MPEKAVITVRYGPYMNGSGAVQHRLSRLEGLRETGKRGRKGKILTEHRESECLKWLYSQENHDIKPDRINLKPEEISSAVLTADGHSIVLEEIPDRNAVELIVNGETVFQCNINELDFGGDGLLDPLCEDARQAVLRAY